MKRSNVIVVAWLVAAACACRDRPRDDDPDGPVAGSKAYSFGSDWFSPKIPIWEEILAPFKGRPNVHYLEVGIHEGRSFFWAMDHIVTHPTSRGIGVDIYSYALWRKNLRASGQASRVTTLIGKSQQVLRSLAFDSFDIIYIDGSHAAPDVLADAVLAWPLLEVGGVIIFDDYLWSGYPGRSADNAWPAELVPRMAIDAFISANRNTIEVLHVGSQMFLRKIVSTCDKVNPSYRCSPLGRYGYEWNTRQLFDTDAKKMVSLTEDERALLEAAARTRDERGRFHIDATMANAPAFQALTTRLGYAFEPRADVVPAPEAPAP